MSGLPLKAAVWRNTRGHLKSAHFRTWVPRQIDLRCSFLAVGYLSALNGRLRVNTERLPASLAAVTSPPIMRASQSPQLSKVPEPEVEPLTEPQNLDKVI
jgi:hypothetical protein